jgi:hypothetical protein
VKQSAVNFSFFAAFQHESGTVPLAGHGLIPEYAMEYRMLLDGQVRWIAGRGCVEWRPSGVMATTATRHQLSHCIRVLRSHRSDYAVHRFFCALRSRSQRSFSS